MIKILTSDGVIILDTSRIAAIFSDSNYDHLLIYLAGGTESLHLNFNSSEIKENVLSEIEKHLIFSTIED